MKKLRLFFLILATALAAFAPDAFAWALFGSSTGNSQGRMKSADKLLEKADTAFFAGDFGHASNEYVRAREKYAVINKNDPDYEDGLPAIRLAYCDEQIALCVASSALPSTNAAPSAASGKAPSPVAGAHSATNSATAAGAGRPPAPSAAVGDSAADAFRAATGEPPPANDKAASEEESPAEPYDARNFAYDFNEARELIEKDRPAAAIEILVPMVRYDPSNRQLRMLLAAAQIRSGRHDLAITALEDLRGRREDLPLLLLIAAAYTSAGRYPDALLSLDAAVKLAPAEPDPYVNLAWLTLLMNDGQPAARKVAGNYYREALKRGAAPDPALQSAVE